MILTAAVRNAMEGFHAEHLSDAQMKELNPIICNAIATDFYGLHRYRENPTARACSDAIAPLPAGSARLPR